uniref:Cytochrome b5 heme-binding domain-containing protein n=1 Tax=Pseudictyota dubia TaxID=2749911 RepID=A0A7R9WDF6_9STRA|mmetsp:Transcript_45549/g.84371  ORF Transcript_45549/g.84371 Transcript_45549/m.84371 type:complete len:820 (+) Transcript_45549:3-2462(+)
MFRESQSESPSQSQSDEIVSLKANFKDVFHNISSILDCVQCQQCKLHGKMAMLGYGTALKILFLPRADLVAASLSRNEVVAFVNTIAKMSESIKEVRELTALYWRERVTEANGREDMTLPAPADSTGGGDGTTAGSTIAAGAGGNLGGVSVSSGTGGVGEADLVDAAVGAAAQLAAGGHITEEREAELVQLAFARDSNLLTLAKYYASDLNKFLLHSRGIGSLGGDGSALAIPEDDPDAVVVGSGLAGLAAALNILDRGGRVVIVEKEHRLGGNSNKASSGINGCCPPEEGIDTHDTQEIFRNDTIKSAGEAAQLPLIDALVENSASAVVWLRERVGVDLSLLAQLGGHGRKRTHRPKNGMVGAEIIYGMQKAVREYEKKGSAKILVDTKVTGLVQDDDGRVVGVDVEYNRGEESRPTRLTATNVVLATGGFASDRNPGSYLDQYRPELMRFPATAGDFSTGDGVALATALGAGTINMDKIQIHPTGWVDPSDPSNPTKVLAAELMRGVGGVLLNSRGERFCNELGTRAYVTDKMLSHHPKYAETGVWDDGAEIPTFSLVLSSSAADDGRKHVSHYTHKKLLTEIQGVTALAEWMGVNVETVRSTLEGYRRAAASGEDEWGKTTFRGVPSSDLDNETFYAGTVVPVLHYCMGGVTIDPEGNVLDGESGKPIPGLHAAGEVSGGVHGVNRLAGNSLLECTVYGTIVGKKLPIKPRTPPSLGAGVQIGAAGATASSSQPTKKEVTPEELAKHSSDDDCWVAIHGNVYDLTEFAEEHPPGAESILELAGTDGTEAFKAIHNENILDDFDTELIGVLVDMASG